MFLRLTLIIGILRAHCQHEGWRGSSRINVGVYELSCLMQAGGAGLLSHGVSAGETWHRESHFDKSSSKPQSRLCMFGFFSPD